MATPAYEGGIGGKFPKRPFRRAAATPYDRPLSAARGLRGLPAAAAAVGGNGWLSKIVDPASRFIACSASRIFSSFFHKRLAASRDASEEYHQSRQEVPEAACLDQRGNCGNDPTKNSDADGISELEQLLKQKTFTRVEFDHLTELLRSRTVEPVRLEPAVSNEKKEKTNGSSQDNKAWESRLYEKISTPASNLTIPNDEAASPAELAKAYMGSRPSKASPSTPSLRTQVFQEDADMRSIVPYVPKPSNFSVETRSVICSSGISKLPENGYSTPKPPGRSAMYRMSCSPYFKAHPTTIVKGGRPIGDVYTGPSPSQLKPRNLMHSGGKQLLKRGNSDLDSDFGSFGPIRRVRQKSYLASRAKVCNSTPLNKNVFEGSTSVHKPPKLGEAKYHSTGLHDAENGERKNSYSSVTPIPPKSSETAMKILQQLDNLVPSPEEKSSETKVISGDKFSSKLTHNMLGGQAPRTMEDIDSSIPGSASLDASSGSQLLSLGNSLSKNKSRVEGSAPSKPPVSGVKLTSEDNSDVPSTDGKPGSTRTTDFFIPGSAALHPRENPTFQTIAPQDSLESDKDIHTTGDAYGSLSKEMDKVESKISKHKTSISEIAISEKSLISSSKNMSSSSTIFAREADMKASGSPAVYTGFSFSAAPAPGTLCQPPPTPTVPTPFLDRSTPQKEQMAAPLFSFGSKAACTLTFSSTMASVTAGQKVRASDACTTTAMEVSDLVKGGDMPNVGDLSKSFGNTASSGIPMSTTSVFDFCASATTGQSNGSLYSSFLTSPVSNAPAVSLYDSRVSSTFSNSTATTTGMSSPSISSGPISSTADAFQFGSTASIGAPVSVSHPVHKSDSTKLEAKPSNTGSSSSSTITPYSSLSNSGRSSFAPTTSVTFSSTYISSSALAPSSTFLSTGKGIFGFSALAQPSTSSLPSANSSQNSITTFGATAGSSFDTQAAQSGSGISQFSQSSTSHPGSSSSSPSFGLGNSSSSGFGSSPFGSTTSGTKPFMSSGFPFSGGSGTSSPDTSSSLAPAAATTLFSPSSQPSTSSVFGFTFGSTTSSPSTGFSFGPPSSHPGSSSKFGSSMGSVLSFTSAGSTTSSTSSIAQPLFGMPRPAVGFSSGSPRNDQMSVEDSMTDDTNQVVAPMVSPFGQPAKLPAAPNLGFGSAIVPSGGPPVFQFGSHQNPFSPQSPSPFQAGNLELPPGGNFSLGSGGGDKSGRRMIRVKRDKLRKK